MTDESDLGARFITVLQVFTNEKRDRVDRGINRSRFKLFTLIFQKNSCRPYPFERSNYTANPVSTIFFGKNVCK
jgi:hypothetical protein